jgi:hypothetical protein
VLRGHAIGLPTNREQRRRDSIMSKEQENKAIVGRWFKEFWGSPWNPRIVDELAAPDMLLQYSLHAPRRGRADVTAFMRGFRAAFPDLNFWGAPRNCARPAKARSYPDIRETFLRIARDYDLIADNIEAADSLRITKTPSDAPR